MPHQDLKYVDLTGKIIGCAMKVHRHFGPGFPENIYHRALKIELEKERLNFLSECHRDVFYDGINIGNRRLDILVEEKVLIELKATTEIEKFHHCQVINYLKVFNIEVGLLLNFGKESLEFKRFVNSNLVNESVKSIKS